MILEMGGAKIKVIEFYLIPGTLHLARADHA